MDTVVLVLLILLLVLVALLLLNSMRLRAPKVQPSKDSYLQRAYTEQILENRRLVNLLVTRTTPEFHGTTVMNPENVGTSPLVNESRAQTQGAWVSSNGDNVDGPQYMELGDEGFDELPGSNPIPR